MTHVSRFAALSVILCIGVFSPAQADSLTVAFSIAKPPFVFATITGPDADEDNRGIELDIMKAALKPGGHTFIPYYGTYSELTADVLDGRVDAAATVRPENQDLFYSTEFVAFHNFAILPAGAPAPTSVADLSGLSMVAWQGATRDLGPIFADAAGRSPDYVEMGDQKAQVRSFLDGRFKALIIDGTIFRYWAKLFGKNAGDYRMYPLFGGRTPFVVGFRDARLRDDFNAGLKEIRQNGVYDLLFSRHLAD